MNDFIPPDYEVPVSGGNYMKLEKGDNVFRVLSSAVIGYEYWNKDDKPVRLKSKPDVLPDDIKVDQNGNKVIKHFWAFAVWNYKAGAVQILEITQKTIQTGIRELTKDVDWGDPRKYDIKITRNGDGLETEYTVSPKPHSSLKSDIEAAYIARPVQLENLFKGEDPFEVRNSDGSPVPKF